MKRRQFVQSLSVAGIGFASGALWAQPAYPHKPIRIICGSAPGALLDVATRLYADRMALDLKQPVVVENIAGASSLLAARAAIKAAPDGYTLMTAANTLVTIPHLSKDAGYRAQDFTPIGEMARSPSVMVVSAASPFRSVADVVAAAKKVPGELTYASGGMGTTSHLPAELFALQAGIKLLHIPYKGVAPAATDVVSNRVGFMMATPTSVAGMVKAGQLRMLAITSESRSPKYPDVPSFKELGLASATFEIWVGMVGPANLPEAVRARVGQAMETARADPAIQHKLDEMGQFISPVRTPDAFKAFFLAEDAKYAQLVKAANIRAE